MPTDGQLISLASHTIGSIGQVLKDYGIGCSNPNVEYEKAVKEIDRIYRGYIKQIAGAWSKDVQTNSM